MTTFHQCELSLAAHFEIVKRSHLAIMKVHVHYFPVDSKVEVGNLMENIE